MNWKFIHNHYALPHLKESSKFYMRSCACAKPCTLVNISVHMCSFVYCANFIDLYDLAWRTSRIFKSGNIQWWIYNGCKWTKFAEIHIRVWFHLLWVQTGCSLTIDAPGNLASTRVPIFLHIINLMLQLCRIFDIFFPSQLYTRKKNSNYTLQV